MKKELTEQKHKELYISQLTEEGKIAFFKQSAIDQQFDLDEDRIWTNFGIRQENHINRMNEDPNYKQKYIDNASAMFDSIEG